MVIRVLPLLDCNSDGDSSKWPTADKGYKRNDDYFLQRIANDFWAKDRDQSDLGGPPSSATWRLDRLPDGYAGFEKARPDSKHVDRYLYGHPRGQFRSLAEFYPHFKHLMDNGGPIGCQCKVCSGNKRASTGGVTSGGNDARSVSPAQKSHYFTQIQTESKAPQQEPPVSHCNTTARPTGAPLLSQGRLSSPTPPRAPRKQVDEDGTTDILRALLDGLKAADDNIVIDRKIVESTSPDWRVGHDLLNELLDDWKSQPRFAPRTGELVLFVSDLKAEEVLAWDENLHTWRKAEQDTGTLLAQPKWEAGVITQMPLQHIDVGDLTNLPNAKDNVVNSGYRVEPLSKPGDDGKRYAKQHRYLPLHGLRPLTYWQDCFHDLPEPEWHPTVKHALSVTNTFCIIGRNRFKAVRDELSGSQATVFCRGAYIGSELITVGDAVRLLPNPDEQKSSEVTDILVVTAIKLRLVNIDDAGNDDWDDGRPYNICLHISGKAFTLDRKRSFDGVGKIPIPSDSDLLPPGLEGYGQWYHFTDPKQTKARLEVPYTRIFSRVQESVALETWFQAPTPKSPHDGIQQFRKPAMAAGYKRLSRGLSGLVQARAYAYAEDPRIDKAAGKSWFWADTRVEALDLHEVNNRFVGSKDDSRDKEQMADWRKALKALDGSKHGLAAYHAERIKREEENKKEKQGLAAGSYGMVGAAVTMPDVTSGSGSDDTPPLAEDDDEDHDMVDVGDDRDDLDEDDDECELAATETKGRMPAMNKDGVIELSDDDD